MGDFLPIKNEGTVGSQGGYIGNIINQYNYKDPYYPTSVMECQPRVLFPLLN